MTCLRPRDPLRPYPLARVSIRGDLMRPFSLPSWWFHGHVYEEID